MKKIININFHSRVVPIEESAYEILQQYIESLRRHFANEEGRDEIISDIENRFAELFSETLKKGAACITDADVNTIIASMGRPEDFEDDEPGTTGTGTGANTQSGYSQQQSNTYTTAEPRRLYRSENDKILGGVAAGLASYLNIDPAIARILFVLTTFIGGSGFLLYLVLWVVLPYKNLPANVRKRLYRNPDDRVIGGVASGLAAYFHIEVWIPRLIFSLPLLLSLAASLFRNVWFHFDGPEFFTGGFGGTLFITYIILWIVLPEAVSASEKLEMRGEKVDLESIKNTIKSDLESFSKKAGTVGAEMKSTFQKTGSKVKQSTQNFTAEAYPAARKTTNGFGRAVGILFKAFFLCIAGLIAFCLIMVLIGLAFRGQGVLTIKNYILTGFWQNVLLWVSFAFFLVLPIVALLTWLIRRITGVRSKHHYLTYAFTSMWVIGLFCTIGLIGVAMNNFRSRQHIEQDVTISNPAHGKLIIKALEGRHEFYDGDDDDWWFDFRRGKHGPFYNLSEDSFILNTVRVNLLKSEDSSYHVKLIKISRGEDSRTAHQRAEEIEFPVKQSDSILYLPQGFTVTRGQKFRNQQVLVAVSVPIGRRIMVTSTVDQYSWFSMDVHSSHIRWDRDDDYGHNWDDEFNTGSQYGWSRDVEYTMTNDGLVRTDKKGVDYKKKKKNDDNNDEEEDKNPDDNPGYRYKNPSAPAQPKTTVDTVKKTAALSAVTDSHLYLLSALFQ